MENIEGTFVRVLCGKNEKCRIPSQAYRLKYGDRVICYDHVLAIIIPGLNYTYFSASTGLR